MGRGAIMATLLTAVACSRGPSTLGSTSTPITTDGVLARSNLEAMIGGREAMLTRDPSSGSVRLTLVSLLQARASTYGRVEDLDRAEQVAETGVLLAPRNAEAWLARAASRSSLHRFREAAADLDRAEALGAQADAVAAQRASIALAQGDFGVALGIARARAERAPGMATLGALGVGLAESGDSAGASAAFARALLSYRDTSPFPVAFVDFQEGLLAERAGDLARAAQRYRAVIQRLPGHAQGAVHLASVEMALGRTEAAQQALQTVLAEASDPEILAVRADLARRRSDLTAAGRDESAARARYRLLLDRHPDAFADHAARFLLDRDPREALRWANHNLSVRQTPEAFDLALTAATRADDSEARCALGRRAEALPAPSPRLQALVADGLAACAQRSGPTKIGSASTARVSRVTFP